MSDNSPQDRTWIDAVALRFERAWKAGPRPQIEAFLAEAPEPQRAPLLTELLLVERELRLAAGELPTAKEYRGRFPEYDAPVTAAFDRDRSVPSPPGRASNLRSTQTLNPSDKPGIGPMPAELANHPDYEIVRRLGAGGMGVVYLARNRHVGRDEVIKVMGPHIIGQPGVSDRFLNEIRAVAKLRHPNIVDFYTAFRCGESLVFTMEYVDGYDLARCIKAKGPFSVTQACAFAHQAALGLQHAHEQGMVHRDIKPSNLMLAGNGKRRVIKLLDFGLARARQEQGLVALSHDGPPSPDGGGLRLTVTRDMLGTPDYIAPEQIVDSHTADIRADIYSLGCTLYCLLTGRPPFEGTLEDVLRAHRSMEAPLLDLVRPDVPPALADVVAKMLAKTPDDRPQVPAEVAVALAPFFTPGSPSLNTWNLAGLPGTTPEPSPGPDEPTTPEIEPDDPTELLQPGAQSLQQPQAGSLERFGSIVGSGHGIVVIPPPKDPSRLMVFGVGGLAAVMLVCAIVCRATPLRDAGPVVATNDPVAPREKAITPDRQDPRRDHPSTAERPAQNPLQPEAPAQRKDDTKRQIAAVTPLPAPKDNAVGPAPPAVAASPEAEKTRPSSTASDSKTPAAPAKYGSTPAEEALSTRGLTKRDTLYVLDSENDFRSGFAELEPLWVQLNKLYVQVDSVAQAVNTYNLRRADHATLQRELTGVHRDKAAFPPGNNSMLNQGWQDLLNYEKALNIQLDALDEELDFRWSKLLPEARQRDLFANFRQTQARFVNESKSLRDLGDKINARYAELRKDDAVKSAITALGLSTKDLGPSQDFMNKRARLKDALKTISPAALSGKPNRSKPTKQRKSDMRSPSTKSGAMPK
jgi:serine/threonine protein kinase